MPPSAATPATWSLPLSDLSSIVQKIKDPSLRARLVKFSEDVALRIADFLNTLLHEGTFSPEDKRYLLTLLRKLVKSTQVLPQSYKLQDIQCDFSQAREGGAFADIFQGEYQGRKVCVKAVRVFQRGDNTRMLRAFAEEIVLSAHLSHENILPFYGIYQGVAERICIVSPWIDGGDLSAYLQSFPHKPRLPLASDVTAGLRYLHQSNIVHGDLKAKNILVSDRGRALIADFGISLVVVSIKLQSTQLSSGTMRWMAPELLKDDDKNISLMTLQSDVWSLGCVFYEIFTRKVPFYHYTHDTRLFSARQNPKTIPSRPTDGNEVDNISDTMWDLMEKCWDDDPCSRPNCDNIHEFIRKEEEETERVRFEPVAPLKVSENRWDRKALYADADSPEAVNHKVRGLLNKLTMERFDSISDQIIEWVNKSEKEKDGRTLIQVIRLVFEKATDEATWSEMYARLCRKMMEQISTKVQDDGIRNSEGKPVAGGQLFRKCLFNKCQEDFERSWVNKETIAAAAATKAMEDQAIKAANEKGAEGGDDEVALYSEEYYAAQKAKRQGLGLIKFIGELFKLQMLTERIMHKYVKKLLGNVNNPEVKEIESLCKLLTTVGRILDTQKAHGHMDVYFKRMRQLAESTNVSSRMQFMLQDVLELRGRKWQARNAVAAPSTIAQIHEAAAKEKAAQEKELSQRQISMSRGGPRRDGDRSDQLPANPEGWAVAGNTARPPSKVDLSNFGKINKAPPTIFGPGSVFVGKKDKRESPFRKNSSSNMFSMLQNAESGADKASEAPLQRRKLALLPRTKPIENETQQQESDEEEASSPALGPAEMSDEAAKKKIGEDSKELFGVRNLGEAEVYFSALPAQHHSKLVDKLVSTAVESKETDAQLVGDLFGVAVSKNLCSPAAFEEGLGPIAEIIEDIAIDAPKAFELFAIMVKGASLDEERRSRLASKSEASEKLLLLLS